MGSKGGGNVEQTTKPWSSVQRGALSDIYAQVPALATQPMQYGPSTVAPFSQTTERALGGLENYGLSATTPVQTAQNTLGDIMGANAPGGPGRAALQQTAAGGFLGGNPFLDAQYQGAADQVTDAYRMGVVPGVDSRFAAGGRVGSGFHARAQQQAQEDYGRTLADMASTMYGQDYARERGLMGQAQGQLAGLESSDTAQRLQAAGMAPALNAAQQDQLRAALAAGSARDDMEQARLIEEAQRFQFGQQEPYQRLGQASQLLGGSSGYSSTTQPTTRNPAAGFLGGAASGAGILGGLSAAGMTAANPYALPIIAGAGLLGAL